MAESRRTAVADSAPLIPTDALWYKDAVIYQVHVKAFCDSNGDGIGDFPGLTGKLDYLQDLGVTAIWLLPFYPSPLRDDGYDIADYNAVHPGYGTLDDFRSFLSEAHRRGLRVITELVCNHTSDQHAWFQRARRAPAGSAERDFYVWSDTTERYQDARIIFQDFETSNWSWDEVAQAYYWHRFFSHQPDLNFEHPAVHEAIFHAMDFWFDLGVDGMRLDAIPYLYEADGTNCENLPRTHEFLQQLRSRVDTRYPGRMLLAEACQWPEDTVAYFGEGAGDECHMAFHFPLMPRLYLAVQQEDSFPIIDILAQTPPIPATSQWAVFLRNHDELTLEMVTAEERDAMLRAYAPDRRARINLGIRRRLAPLMRNDRAALEVMNSLLFSLPGTPILYYGDEIGMGDNVYLSDRNGVRTPMQWSAERNAGFSAANPQALSFPLITDPTFHYEIVNVAAQRDQPHSLLSWTQRMIALRRQYPLFGRGTIAFLPSDNEKLLTFTRSYDGQTLLVVVNLARSAQAVTLDLRSFAGRTPFEVVGGTTFPPISAAPYVLTLPAHSFYWLLLEDAAAAQLPDSLPTLACPHGDWRALLHGRNSALQALLPHFLRTRRWFGSKARRILRARPAEHFSITAGDQTFVVLLVDVEFAAGAAEQYLLTLAAATGAAADALLAADAGRVIAQLDDGSARSAVLYEALNDPAAASALLTLMSQAQTIVGSAGSQLQGNVNRVFTSLNAAQPDLTPQPMHGEQSNSSVIFGSTLIMKLYRTIAAGRNPDLELGSYLTEQTDFRQIPPAAGWLEVQRPGAEPLTLAFLQGYVANQGNAFAAALRALQQSLDQPQPAAPPDILRDTTAQLAAAEHGLPTAATAFAGSYLDSAALLGRRTAEMHRALAAGTTPPIAPEAFSSLYQRSLYQSTRTLTIRTLQRFRALIPGLPAELQSDAARVADGETLLLDRLHRIVGAHITAQRTRTHGDFHLEQVLFTGDDYVIIDFEGEPGRPISERRIKRSPLRDVAGILRSYEYVAQSALLRRPTPADSMQRRWAEAWAGWAGAAFLQGYLAAAAGSRFLPDSSADLAVLLETYVIEKAVYELHYEMNNRPDWLIIPLRGILAQLDAHAASAPQIGDRT